MTESLSPVADIRSVWCSVDGLRLHARVADCAPIGPGACPLVLVHGLSVSSRYMMPTARLLAARRATYAPDLPGFGLSAKPRRTLDVPALADALLAWMDAFGLGRAVMLGNSLGCQIIADVAVRRPERLAAAVLVGPTADPAVRSVLGYAWRLLRDLPGESLASIVTQSSDYIRAGPRRTLGTLRYALVDQFRRKLPFVHVPTLVVRGDRDPIAPHTWCAELAEALPHGELYTVPGGPHALNYVCPHELAHATLAFLARHPQVER